MGDGIRADETERAAHPGDMFRDPGVGNCDLGSGQAVHSDVRRVAGRRGHHRVQVLQ